MKIKGATLLVAAILPEEVREHNGREYKSIKVECTDTDDHEYPSDYELTVSPPKYKLLEGLATGDKITVTVSLTGKKGNKGTFMRLTLLELQIDEKAGGNGVHRHGEQVSSGAGFYPVAQPAPQAQNTAENAPAAMPGGGGLDDLPF